MVEVTTLKRIEEIIEKENLKRFKDREFFVIQSSDFDNSDIMPGENHWRDFSLNIKKNLKIEIVNLEEGHDDEYKSDLLCDLLKVNFKGCLFGELKTYDLNKNNIDLCLGLKSSFDLKTLENILKDKNFEFKEKFVLGKNKIFEILFNDSKIRIIPMNYEDAVQRLNNLRIEDSKKGNILNLSFSLFYDYNPQLDRNFWIPRKVFHSFDFIRNSGYYFGQKIIDYASKRDIKNILIYGIYRGGSSIANCISEEIRKNSKLNVDVGVIIASSYINMTKKDLEIKYIVPDKSKAANYDLILIVDDLVDTGTTIKRVLNSFEDSAREKIKTVVLDLKERTYKREEKLFPDYLRLKIKINSHKEEIWIVYDGELEGLTEKEIKSVYKNLYKKEKEDKVKDFERKSLH